MKFECGQSSARIKKEAARIRNLVVYGEEVFAFLPKSVGGLRYVWLEKVRRYPGPRFSIHENDSADLVILNYETHLVFSGFPASRKRWVYEEIK